ncbi:MAG TPA: hypothetical protein VHY09_04965 [Candidatus Methylacidiphilales bacterium]|nr:hypothetical protein [Candidatus Methylacidiphilales bacterium]
MSPMVKRLCGVLLVFLGVMDVIFLLHDNIDLRPVVRVAAAVALFYYGFRFLDGTVAKKR